MTAAQGEKGQHQALYWELKKPQAATFFMPPLCLEPSALLVLGIACEDKIVIVELSQLAIKTLVALEFLGRRKNTSTFGALREAKSEKSVSDKTAYRQEKKNEGNS